MRLFRTIIENHRKKIQERNNACNDLVSRIDNALSDAKSIFLHRKHLLIHLLNMKGDAEISRYWPIPKIPKYCGWKKLTNIKHWWVSELNWTILLVLWRIGFSNTMSELWAWNFKRHMFLLVMLKGEKLTSSRWSVLSKKRITTW